MAHFEETKRLLENSNFYYVVCIDMQGLYIYVNSNFARTYCFITDNFIGKSGEIDVHPDDVKISRDAARRCLSNPGSAQPVTIRKIREGGGHTFTQWEFHGMYGDDGRPEGIFCIGFDISTFVTELERKDDILRGIAWNQSHVIRRPLANILGLLQILDRTGMDENMRNLFEMLQLSADQLDEEVRRIVEEAGN